MSANNRIEVVNSSESKETELQFTREKIETHPGIKLVDKDEETGLEQFCYTKCQNGDSSFLKKCRGLVYNGHELVLKSFPYTVEYTDKDSEKLQSIFNDMKNWSFFPSFEGALIRVFYFRGKWFLSTHRKLDAFRSRWSSSKSFGEIFIDAIDTERDISTKFRERLDRFDSNILNNFYSSLDKRYKYMFLLLNTSENRIVCYPDQTKILHVGTFLEDDTFSFDVDCGIPSPKRLHFENLNYLLSFVSEVNISKIQGVICFSQSGEQIKIVNQRYMELFKARGNEPSVKFRYLQVRRDNNMRSLLYSLYPEHVNTFDNYENIIEKIAVSIYNAYVDRFIRKEYVVVGREEYAVVSECHSWYLSDRAHNKICLDKVREVLNRQNPVNLNTMIRRYNTQESNTIVPQF